MKWPRFKQTFFNSSKAHFQTCLLLMLFYKRMWLEDSSLLWANIFSFTLGGKFSKHWMRIYFCDWIWIYSLSAAFISQLLVCLISHWYNKIAVVQNRPGSVWPRVTAGYYLFLCLWMPYNSFYLKVFKQVRFTSLYFRYQFLIRHTLEYGAFCKSHTIHLS